MATRLGNIRGGSSLICVPPSCTRCAAQPRRSSPGVGAHLASSGLEGLSSEDRPAIALLALAQEALHDGILPALETSHALAWLLAQRGQFDPQAKIVLNLSGRGDKDLSTLLGEGAA